MGIVPTAPIVRGTVSVGVWAMNDETPPRGGSAGAGCRCGFLAPTGDVTQEHVVEVSLPTPAALAPTTAVQPAVEPTSLSPTSRWTPPWPPRIPSTGTGRSTGSLVDIR